MSWKIIAYFAAKSTYQGHYTPAYTEIIVEVPTAEEARKLLALLTSKSIVPISQALNISSRKAEQYLNCTFSIEES